jgi:hypothetical protein
MIVACPHCHHQHRLPEDIELPPNSAAHCKKCGKRFLLEAADERPVQELGAPGTTNEKSAASQPSPATNLPNGSEPTAAILDAFPELQGLPLEKFLLAEIFMPGDKNHHQTSLNRLLAKLITATAPLLSESILQRDELVCRIASGIAYFPFEIPYANGLLTWPLNYYALICTNRRLIFINLDYHLSRPTRFVFQIPYDDIARVSRGFYGSSLIVTTDSGRNWDFTTVNRRLGAGLDNFIRTQREQLHAGVQEYQAPSQLCPACYQPVPEKMISCPHCQTPYKSAKVAMKKSLVLPGTGNIYLANPYLGIIEILGYLFTWIMTIILVIIGIPGGILGGGVLVLTYHLMAALMARRIGEKGYLVINKQPEEISPSKKFARKFLKIPRRFTE